MKYCFWIVLYISLVSQSHAGTIYTTSGSDSDVQAKINEASPGDTVLLPANSSFTWNTGVNIPNGGIILNLNGSTITRGSGTAYLIQFNANPTNKTEITGGTTGTYATLIQNTTATQIMGINGSFSDSCWRVDHLNFTTTTGSSILMNIQTAWGVIDHCNFAAGLASEMIHNVAWGAGSSGHNGWTDVVTPGSLNAVYVEDCTFTNNGVSGNPAYFYGCSAIQGYYGCRTVLRHDTFYMCQIDMHGGQAPDYGARWWEIYSNNWVMVPNGNQDRYCALRNGSGVVFGNTLTGSANQGSGAIDLSEESDTSYYGPPGRGINGTVYPAYVWNNSSTMNVTAQGVSGTDYFLTAMPGYTAAVYPHPLTQNGQAGNGVLEPPTGFRVVTNAVSP